MSSQNFFAELKRRNVYKVAIGYCAVGWFLIQAAVVLFPLLSISNDATILIISMVVVGFPIALFIAWRFEMTPQGMKRTENVSADEHIPQWSQRKFATLVIGAALLGTALLLFHLLQR